MLFRYFDSSGKRLTYEQLRSLHITTPVMEHVFATVESRRALRGDCAVPAMSRRGGLV